MGRFHLRYAQGGVLTAQQALDILPTLILMLLADQVQVVFPGTDTPSPSPIVVLIPKIPVTGQGYLSFRGVQVSGPVVIRWDQWENCVVPLLLEIQGANGIWANLNITNPLNRKALCHVGDARDLIDRLGRVIEQSFAEHGYGSPTT